MMPDNLRHAQYREDGTQIDDPQLLRGLTDSQIQASGTGAGVSTDAGNALTLGTDSKPFLNLKTVNGSSLVGTDNLSVSATPGGSTTQMQFNDGGAFAGSSGLTWDKTTNTLTIASGTQTASNPLTYTQTFNNAAVDFVGKTNNFTNTASGVNTVLERWRVDGTDAFSIQKSAGGFAVGAGTGGYTRGIYTPLADNSFYFKNAYISFGWRYGDSALAVNGGGAIGFCSGAPDATSLDTRLYRDAANTWAQRNGTNAQEDRIYGTYTDASNYRRVSLGMSTAGVGHIRPEGAGTGASSNVLHISGLPTSNPGPGILWNDSGTVKVGT